MINMRTSVAGPMKEGTTKGWGGSSLLALLALGDYRLFKWQCSCWTYRQLPGEVSHSRNMWRNTSYIEMCTMWLDETIHNNKFSSSPTLFLENYPLMISKAYRPGFSTFNHLQIIRVATAGVGMQFTVCSNEAAAAKWADKMPYCCIRTASNVFALQNMSHLWGNQTLCLHMEPQEHDPYNIKNSWVNNYLSKSTRNL